MFFVISFLFLFCFFVATKSPFSLRSLSPFSLSPLPCPRALPPCVAILVVLNSHSINAVKEQQAHCKHPAMSQPNSNNYIRLKTNLRNMFQSPAFAAAMKHFEIAFRLGFRFMITPIFVGVAVAMMSSVAYYWFELVQPAWGHPSGTLTWFLNTGVGIWLLFNVGWNYFRCMFTPSYHPLPTNQAGHTHRESDCTKVIKLCRCPNNHAPYVVASNKIDNNNNNTASTSSSSGTKQVDVDAWNFCKKCDLITPPRAMHCFLCNRCVLGMDHHCPWLATCIGYHNHAYFFLFLFYVVVGCLYLATWTFPMFYSIIVQKKYRMWDGIQIRRDRFALTMLGVLPATFVVAVGGMMVWHGIVLACGATSLEFKYVVDWIKDIIVERQCLCRKDNARDNNDPTLRGESSGHRSGVNKRRHPFDQGGMIENWKEIFGVRGRKFWWILWCMPISHERSGNGIDQFVCQPSQHNKGRYTPIHV